MGDANGEQGAVSRLAVFAALFILFFLLLGGLRGLNSEKVIVTMTMMTMNLSMMMRKTKKKKMMIK